MSLTFGFYNSINGDRVYDAIQVGQIFDGIITDGIYATYLKAMVVKASDNASEVIVQPGRAWFNHTWTYIDADYPVEAPAPEVILDRVDTLVLDINAEYSNRENKIIWVQGTPASVNPEAPSLINTTTHHQYPLCNVYRKAGTTMIYAADITNRVGTSATPFVTGVLTGINIDDLLSQWDDEFHTWENATKVSFEGWMVNQQSVYTTWFESIRTQMAGDLDEFEAWFETIRGIIDEEAATHLQAEIDKLKDMLPAGSHIDISTNESTLFNRNVTVSDGVHSKTVQFNAVGGATVESFPYIGAISITSTDGERTAQETINIPYFGRYSVVLAFWAATVNLVGDSAVGGVPVTVKDSDDLTITTIVLDASGRGTFTATKPDTYKFIYTYGGQTMETTLQVTQETTYEVEIHGGFNYQAWLTAGRVSKTFTSLDDILADEETLRQLFLVHDSIDYICDTFNTGSVADITKIFNTDIAAKWINLSDYALDKFYAVADIKTVMDTADKYGYGEWALMPQVPKMASNTTPFGVASMSSTNTDNPAYKAFDGDDTTFASLHYDTSNGPHSITYKFVQPVCVKKYRYFQTTSSTTTTYFDISVKLQGSNDGSTWDDIATNTINLGVKNDNYFEVSNDDYYLYYRLYFPSALAKNDSNWYFTYPRTIQFYAWAPKGNVPKMTSNTAPFGVVSASAAVSGYEAYKVFNESIVDMWAANSTGSIPVGYWLKYKFTNPISIKKVRCRFATSASYTIKFQGSNDDFASDVHDLTGIITVPSTMGQVFYVNASDITDDSYYLSIRMYVVTAAPANTGGGVYELQFYGRELKVSVPTMTSNTAPYGTAVSSIAETNYEAFKAFDNNDSTYFCPPSTTTAEGTYLGYIFRTPMKLQQIRYRCTGGSGTTMAKVQYSDDGGTTWNDQTTSFNYSIDDTYHVVNIENASPHKAWRVYKISALIANSFAHKTLQFYGEDYSEKEFEEGTTKKWLYDHGVELEEMQDYTVWSGAVYRHEDSSIYLEQTTASNGAFVGANLDLTSYNLARAKIGNIYYSPGTNAIRVINSMSSATTIATKEIANADMPNNVALNISSVNDTHPVGLLANYSSKATLTELWLE